MLIQKMHETLDQLLKTIGEGDAQKAKEAQERFTQAVEEAWQSYQEGKITTHVRGKAIPRLIYLYVIHELPKVITDPKRWPEIVKELHSMEQITRTVVTPEEVNSSQ